MTQRPDNKEGRWIQLCPTPSNDGLRTRDGTAIDPATLPISDELRERLAAWCDRLMDALADETLTDIGRNLAVDSAPYARAMALAHSLDAEGLAIARAFKAELPSWTVYYYDADTVTAPHKGPDAELGVVIESP